MLQFGNAPTGNYYIVNTYRNNLETWSANTVSMTRGSTVSYNFTIALSQAYGNNLTLKGTKYCNYRGDVNQDGFVDLADITMVFNGASAFATGYVITDLNGNNIADLTDITIANNNSAAFVALKRT